MGENIKLTLFFLPFPPGLSHTRSYSHPLSTHTLVYFHLS